jgi:predicted dehydrogenase
MPRVSADASFADLPQSWPLPTRPRPIVVIGAGSIVRDAHLPVYRYLNFPVAGIYDIDREAAAERAKEFGLPRVFGTIDEAAVQDACVFDVAVPPAAIVGILGALHPGAAVLLQKPMGRHLDEARAIVDICEEKRMTAAINFQLRFAPNMLALKRVIDGGFLGALTDIEVRINLHTPWEYWKFLRCVPRLEVLMHSIHYLDLIRYLAGEARGVYCKAVRHPDLPGYADARTSIILDYGDAIRCSLTMNHTHTFGPDHAMSQIKVEGSRGAAIARMGVNLNYPHGEPDELALAVDGAPWTDVPLRGSWFLEAFEGPMSNLQRVVAREDAELVSPVKDAFRTMAVVEACYESSRHGATLIPER